MNAQDELIEKARSAREKAQAIFSKFQVGAALRTKSGRIFTGANIESSSYGLTICAERVAIFKALSEGETEISEIAVVAEGEKAVSPCGACRQIMVDYAEEATVYLANLKDDRKETTVKALLPDYFNKEYLL